MKEETLKDALALGVYTYLVLQKIDTISFESLVQMHSREECRKELGGAIRVLVDCKLVAYCPEEHFITVLDGSDYVAPKQD